MSCPKIHRKHGVLFSFSSSYEPYALSGIVTILKSHSKGDRLLLYTKQCIEHIPSLMSVWPYLGFSTREMRASEHLRGSGASPRTVPTPTGPASSSFSCKDFIDLDRAVYWKDKMSKQRIGR